MSHKVASEGSAVFRENPADWRKVWLVPVGGVLLRCRFPLITANPFPGAKPTVREEIRMSDKPRPGKPTQSDPYKTLPLEDDVSRIGSELMAQTQESQAHRGAA